MIGESPTVESGPEILTLHTDVSENKDDKQSLTSALDTSQDWHLAKMLKIASSPHHICEKNTSKN